MGKRSDFTRKKHDFYRTPKSCVDVLLPHLPRHGTFCEPCAGDGALVRHLASKHKCVSAFDIAPQTDDIREGDASFITEDDLNGADMIITNPPWDRAPLHQIIERCAILRPTWLLFDADWVHTKQARHSLQLCVMIISVGRVQWIEGSGMSGKDNCCWYLFNATDSRRGNPTFKWRT